MYLSNWLIIEQINSKVKISRSKFLGFPCLILFGMKDALIIVFLSCSHTYIHTFTKFNSKPIKKTCQINFALCRNQWKIARNVLLSIVALYGIFLSCVAFYWFSWDRSVALYWYRLLQKLCRLLLIFTCLGGILEVSPFIENITRPKTSQIVALLPCRGVAFYAGP